jgi:hypothetical protein
MSTPPYVMHHNQEQAERSIKWFEESHGRPATEQEKRKIMMLWDNVKELKTRSDSSGVGAFGPATPATAPPKKGKKEEKKSDK